MEGLIELDLIEEGRSAQPVLICASLSTEHKVALHELLMENKKVFHGLC